MTQADWLKVLGTDPVEMLCTARGTASSRQLRLFLCAVCRSHWASLKAPELRQAVEVAERYADHLATKKELQAAARAAESALPEGQALDSPPQVAHSAVQADEVMLNAAFIATARDPDAQQWQCGVLRDVLGNPFGLAILEPTGLTPFVKSLAKDIYEARRFEDLPVLADALEEGGCTNTDLLAHCRQPEAHVRGCWAVDLILGKR